MSDVQWIWRFGRWVAERPHGSITLTWSGGKLLLKVAGGRIVGIEGLDLGTIGAGPDLPMSSNLLEEAAAIARRRGLSGTEGVAAVKEALEHALDAWLSDSQRKLETVEEAPPAGNGPTISLSHAIVETVLVHGSDELPQAILPDLQVILRRAPGFLERYASLQLSEEADLIVAKITGQRTAEDIVRRNPNDQQEVLRLLAALVAAGLLEPVPVATPDAELAEDVLMRAPSPDEPVPRRFASRWIVAAAFAILILLAVVAFLLSGARKTPKTAPGAWGIVVDRGCEPQDLQRILNKAGRFPDTVRAERTDAGHNGPCWQLIWGRYDTKEAARQALPTLPRGIRHEGIDLEVVPLAVDSQVPAKEKGGNDDRR